MKVEIDDSIRRRPELFNSVQQSNAFLEELVGSSSPKVRVEWRLSPHDERLVELGLFEDFTAGIRPTFPAEDLLDPVNRKLRLLRSWDFILQAQSDRNRERIRELIHQLEREGFNGGEVAH
jgi:hypothetical protein